MAAKQKTNQKTDGETDLETNQKSAKPSISSLIDDLLSEKTNEGKHYNTSKKVEKYRVSTGSLELDLYTGGGYPKGITRLVGNSEAGKSRNALEVARNHQLQFPDSYIIVINAEGRNDEQLAKDAGINTSPEKYKVIHSNHMEFVLDFIIDMVNKIDDKKLLFILDSANCLVPESEMKKNLSDPQKTMSSAAIFALAHNKLNLPINVKGHMAILLSQVRAKPKMSKYEKDDSPDNSNASGPNSIVHASNYTIQFEKRNQSTDIIKEIQDKPLTAGENKALGHWCKVTFIKSDNEATGTKLKYPIRYRVKGKSAVWRELEIFDCLDKYKLIKAGGAWIELSDSLVKEIQRHGKDIADTKFRGKKNFLQFLEDNEPICDILFDYIKTVLIDY